jgi:hypothetical protein
MARKKSQLVCQHLENISRRMLEEYQKIIRDFVRGRNGVYALYRKGKLYYVGLAGSLLGRLNMHLRDRHAGTWDRFSVYLTIGPAYMKEIESLLLRIANPPGNGVKGHFVRCENLLNKVKAEYRRRRKTDEEELFGSRRRRKPAITTGHGGNGDGAKTPVLMGYLPTVKKLKGRFKGQSVQARVLRSGKIRFDGTIFSSPSMAAAKACGRRSCNGWSFWRFERAPGDWVPLKMLRN